MTSNASTTAVANAAYARSASDVIKAASGLNVATRDKGTYLATMADAFLADGGTGQSKWLSANGFTVSQAFLSHAVQTTRVIAEATVKADRKSKKVYDDLFGAAMAVKMSTLQGRKVAVGFLTESALNAMLVTAKEHRADGESLADALLRVESDTFQARAEAYAESQSKAEAKGKGKGKGKRGARPEGNSKEGKGDKGDTMTLAQHADAMARHVSQASKAEVKKAETALADLLAVLLEASGAE